MGIALPSLRYAQIPNAPPSSIFQSKHPPPLFVGEITLTFPQVCLNGSPDICLKRHMHTLFCEGENNSGEASVFYKIENVRVSFRHISWDEYNFHLEY